MAVAAIGIGRMAKTTYGRDVFGNDCCKAIVHEFKYRRDLRSSDVVAIAERAFYLGCLQSPFYGWMR